jgi:protein-arginine kinase activator protein McsA
METYRITEDGKAIICLLCGRTSYNFEDVRRLYCGNCLDSDLRRSPPHLTLDRGTLAAHLSKSPGR